MTGSAEPAVAIVCVVYVCGVRVRMAIARPAPLVDRVKATETRWDSLQPSLSFWGYVRTFSVAALHHVFHNGSSPLSSSSRYYSLFLSLSACWLLVFS